MNVEESAIPRTKKSPPATAPSAGKLLSLVEATLDDDKALNVVAIKLTGKSDMADYMVVASGTSGRHVASMAEHLRAQMKTDGIAKVAVEGLQQADWVLVDGGDVVVHIFRPEVREFYNLEKMWGDANTARHDLGVKS